MDICEKVQEEYPEYTMQIVMDTDFSEQASFLTSLFQHLSRR